MRFKDMFPIGIATGAAFCNRVDERALLAKYINHNRHTVLLAPRRYGKTSLVNQVIRELKYPYCEMDFLLSATMYSAKIKIIERAGELLYQLLPRTRKTKEKIFAIFRKMRPEIILSAAGQKVILHAPENDEAPEQTICDVLMNLDKAAAAAKKRVVIFMDEFQQIGQLGDYHVVEAGIRHAVERSTHVSYIFSGSNRHMLQQMFSDKSRPFYKLCAIMHLERISADDYIPFIQKQAKNKWKKNLDEKVIEYILNLSQRHPYYVNLICNYLWLENKIPTIAAIDKFWQSYTDSEKAMLSAELSSLSNNQKTLIRELAGRSIEKPYSNDFLKTTGLTIASQKQAMNKLLQKDLVYVDAVGKYRILDPAIEYYINLL